MNQTVQALCARCRVMVERVGEPNPEDRYACPVCGEGDTHDAIVTEVGEYVVEMAAQKVSDMFAGIGRKSSALSVRSSHRLGGGPSASSHRSSFNISVSKYSKPRIIPGFAVFGLCGWSGLWLR